jgi:hypothetical protein
VPQPPASGPKPCLLSPGAGRRARGRRTLLPVRASVAATLRWLVTALAVLSVVMVPVSGWVFWRLSRTWPSGSVNAAVCDGLYSLYIVDWLLPGQGAWRLELSPPLSGRVVPTWYWWHFAVRDAHHLGSRWRTLVFPTWTPAVLALAACTAVWVGPVRRRARLRRKGSCTNCGYDLRATPSATICPECGTPREVQPEPTPARIA